MTEGIVRRPLDSPTVTTDLDARRRFYRACAIGGLLAAVPFIWMLAIGRLDLLQSGELDNFYDAQAHSLLDGHWDVPRDELSIEAFIVDGKAYMYFGPAPALLRLPVAALTDRLDGRLAQLSMLGAFAVTLVFTARLSWRIRGLVRGNRAVDRNEAWAAGAFLVVVGAGSILLFLASRTLVYHESELWGAALAIAAYDFVLAFIVKPEPRHLAGAGVFAGLALLTRASVGAGPVVALGVLLTARLLVAAHARLDWRALLAPLRWLGLGDRAANRSYSLPLAIAVAVPAAVYAYVNYAKFGSLYSIPFDEQAFTKELRNPDRLAALADNGGSLFGLKFVPTTALAMLRPDGMALDRLFPWVTFPSRTTVVGDVTFDTIDRAASIPATMPALFTLSLVGLVAVFRPRRAGASGPGVAALRVPALGALAGGFVTLTIAFVAHRYISDFLPLLVLASLAGLHVLLHRLDTPATRRALVRAVAFGLAALAALSLWVNFGLAILHQRAFSGSLSEDERAGFIGFQHDVDQALPGGTRLELRRGEELPKPGPTGRLFVLGDCDGLYWSNGDAWGAVERTGATGRYRLRVRFPSRPPGTREPLVVTGTPGSGDYLAVEYRDDSEIAFTFESELLDVDLAGEPRAIEPGRQYQLDVVHDPRVGSLRVDVDGEPALDLALLLHAGPVTIGRTDIGGPVDEEFAGRIERVPVRSRLCSEIVGEAGVSARG